MKQIFLFLSLFVFALASYGQDALVFPDDFLGIYKGQLEITTPRGKQKIPMEFHLQVTDSSAVYNYVLVYNGKPRNYSLKVLDKEKKVFEIDENNGIVLPVKFVDNTLYSFFEVQGNFLSSRLAFQGTQLEFEILFTAMKNKVITGKGTKEIPFVYGYPINVVQRALLRRQK